MNSEAGKNLIIVFVWAVKPDRCWDSEDQRLEGSFHSQSCSFNYLLFSFLVFDIMFEWGLTARLLLLWHSLSLLHLVWQLWIGSSLHKTNDLITTEDRSKQDHGKRFWGNADRSTVHALFLLYNLIPAWLSRRWGHIHFDLMKFSVYWRRSAWRARACGGFPHVAATEEYRRDWKEHSVVLQRKWVSTCFITGRRGRLRFLFLAYFQKTLMCSTSTDDFNLPCHCVWWRVGNTAVWQHVRAKVLCFDDISCVYFWRKLAWIDPAAQKVTAVMALRSGAHWFGRGQICWEQERLMSPACFSVQSQTIKADSQWQTLIAWLIG